MRCLTTFWLFSFLITGFMFTGCSDSNSDIETTNIQSITALDAGKLYENQQAIIVDVREKSEWDAKHIPGAIHIPIAQLKGRIAELEEYKTSPVIMQCQSGVRSAQGSVMLKAAGFSNVYNLEGGILSWSKEGLVTE